MPRKRFTDAWLRSLKPSPKGKRLDHMDEVEPGMGIRVTDKGQATFVFVARYPGSTNPTRRALGEFGSVPMRADQKPVMELAAAREKARQWRQLINDDIDPRKHEEERRAAERKRRDATVAVVVDEYLKRHVSGQRKAAQVEREIRANILPAWGGKPITSITREDVTDLIQAIADRTRQKQRRAPGAGPSYQGHNVLGHVRALFNWAIDLGVYGLVASPCDRLNATRIAGKKKPRRRVLNDEELRAFWRAADRLGYPFGPMFKLLLLTGQRLSEVSKAQWREFHPEFVHLVQQRKADEAIDWRRVPDAVKSWTVPAERFKSDTSQFIPLSDDACVVLAGLPLFKGQYLLSTTAGRKPVSGFSKAKKRLDRRMERTLKAMARLRGVDARQVSLEPFVNHDLRRSMRTRLSSLRVPDEVSEMIVGHGRKGLQRVYDQWQYQPEMREALTAWAGRLREIVDFRRGQIVTFPAVSG